MAKSVLLAAAVLLLSACTAEVLQDGYQPGDGLAMAADAWAKVNAAVVRYCSVAEHDPARNAALAIIRVYYPLVPADGICMQLLPAATGK